MLKRGALEVIKDVSRQLKLSLVGTKSEWSLETSHSLSLSLLSKFIQKVKFKMKIAV